MKNFIVIDFAVDNNSRWQDLRKTLQDGTKMEWEFYGSAMKNQSFRSVSRYLNYFKVGLTLFAKRKQIDNILSIQQFYGIFLAFFLRLFNSKTNCKILILSFIYRQRGGILGIIYHRFIQYCVQSRYIDALIVHSEGEVELYKKQLMIPDGRVKFCKLGVTDDTKDYEIKKEFSNNDEKYFLSVGNSNRDFQFLIDCLENTDISVKMISYELPNAVRNKIQTYSAVSADEYYKYLAKSYATIISLKDEDMSSGQLVILQSYAFGKPVIITKTNGCKEYLHDECSITIKKNKEDLLDAVQKLLNDKILYSNMSKQCSNIFKKNYTLEAMGYRLSSIINDRG